jgi:hypothetical protein
VEEVMPLGQSVVVWHRPMRVLSKFRQIHIKKINLWLSNISILRSEMESVGFNSTDLRN